MSISAFRIGHPIRDKYSLARVVDFHEDESNVKPPSPMADVLGMGSYTWEELILLMNTISETVFGQQKLNSDQANVIINRVRQLRSGIDSQSAVLNALNLRKWIPEMAVEFLEDKQRGMPYQQRYPQWWRYLRSHNQTGLNTL